MIMNNPFGYPTDMIARTQTYTRGADKPEKTAQEPPNSIGVAYPLGLFHSVPMRAFDELAVAYEELATKVPPLWKEGGTTMARLAYLKVGF